MSRLGKEGRRLLSEQGELSVASSRSEDLFKSYVVPAACNAAKKPLYRTSASMAVKQFKECLTDAGADGCAARALATQLHTSAFSACVECIVRTQDDPAVVAKVTRRQLWRLFTCEVTRRLQPPAQVLFDWGNLWENAVDDARPFNLEVEANFVTTKGTAQLALHAPATARRKSLSPEYLPSQVSRARTAPR